MPWVYNPHVGGKNIPPAVRARTERRILDYAAKEFPEKFVRIEVRFRGALCYLDAFREPDEPLDRVPPEGETREVWLNRLRNTPIHLCRIRYFGSDDRWSFAWYSYSTEKYEPSVLITGEEIGTPEEALETSTQFW